MEEMQPKRGRKPKEKRYDAKFAEILRGLLCEKEDEGITLSTVAEELGVTRQSLAQYRDGGSIPDVVILGRMADYFRVSTDYLLGRTEIKTDNPDIKQIHDLTGLSQDAAEYLCSNKSPLEFATLNAVFESLSFHLPHLAYFVLNRYKVEAFQEAAFKKYLEENNLAETSNTLTEKGKRQLILGIERYYEEKAREIKENSSALDKQYQDFLLREAAEALISDACVYFSTSDIANHYEHYYSQLLEFNGDCEKIAALALEEYDYFNKIVERKEQNDNGSNNPPKE